jgi:D-alanyl-D-alanine dipeptidase
MAKLKQRRVAVVEPLLELNRIKIKDNGEPLVNSLDVLKKVVLRDLGPIKPNPHNLYARESVVNMLKQAQKKLPRGHKLVLMSLFRPIKQQERLYKKVSEDFKRDNPTWPNNILRRQVNRWVHPPDVKTPPGHSTGGAVDLLIAGRDGKPLDFTAPYKLDYDDGGDNGKSYPTFSKHIDDTARKNREMLIEIMSEVGFTNYAGEFWHWSYGDSCWAWRLNRKTAIYDAIDPPKTKR